MINNIVVWWTRLTRWAVCMTQQFRSTRIHLMINARPWSSVLRDPQSVRHAWPTNCTWCVTHDLYVMRGESIVKSIISSRLYQNECVGLFMFCSSISFSFCRLLCIVIDLLLFWFLFIKITFSGLNEWCVNSVAAYEFTVSHLKYSFENTTHLNYSHDYDIWVYSLFFCTCIMVEFKMTYMFVNLHYGLSFFPYVKIQHSSCAWY